jgi:hypothetical protein
MGVFTVKGISKAIIPIGLAIVLSGLFYMGYDAIKAAAILGVGGIVLAVGLFDVFRWDGQE